MQPDSCCAVAENGHVTVIFVKELHASNSFVLQRLI